MVCRNKGRAEAAKEEIVEQSKNEVSCLMSTFSLTLVVLNMHVILLISAICLQLNIKPCNVTLYVSSLVFCYIRKTLNITLTYPVYCLVIVNSLYISFYCIY